MSRRALIASLIVCGSLLFIIFVCNLCGNSFLTLQRAVDMAIENNEAVLKAEQQLKKASANLKMARADQYPQISLTGFYERWKEENEEREEYKDYEARLSLEQLLTRFGRVPEYLDQAQENYRLTKLDYERVRKRIVYEVTDVFYDILLVKEELAERRKLSATISEKLKRVKERKKAGFLLKINVLNTELELAEQRREINELSRQLELDRAELVKLTGNQSVYDMNIYGEIPEEENYTLSSAQKIALENRLEIKELKGQIERQERLVRETFWNRIPELSASFRYKDSKISLKQQNNRWDTLVSYELPLKESEAKPYPETQISSYPSSPALEWEFRLSATFSLFDGYFTSSVEESEKAELARLQLQLKELKKQIAFEVRRAYQAVASALELVEIESKAVELQKENLRLIETLLETGQESKLYRVLTFDDVVQAREDFTKAQQRYFSARANFVKAKQSLWKKMGLIEVP